MWKIGDKFKRVRPHAFYNFPAEKVFTVRLVRPYSVECEEGHAHDFGNITATSTADLLAQAEAEVARLKKQLKAESEPKVGDVWVSAVGVSARVVHIEGDMIFYVARAVTSTGDVFNPIGGLISFFTRSYTKKVPNHD